MLDHEAIDETVRKKGILDVEVDLREELEGTRANRGEIRSRLGRAQQRKARPLAALVEERVVEVVEPLVEGDRGCDPPQEPVLLVPPDVCEIQTSGDMIGEC